MLNCITYQLASGINFLDQEGQTLYHMELLYSSECSIYMRLLYKLPQVTIACAAPKQPMPMLADIGNILFCRYTAALWMCVVQVVCSG